MCNHTGINTYKCCFLIFLIFSIIVKLLLLITEIILRKLWLRYPEDNVEGDKGKFDNLSTFCGGQGGGGDRQASKPPLV